MTMTGQELLSAVLHKEPVDRLAWTTLVDGNTLGNLPPGLRGMAGLDFYRYIGCSIFMLDCWDLPYQFASPVFKWPAWVKDELSVDGEVVTQSYATPERTLTRITRRGHPIRYPVQTVADVELYRQMWQEASFAPADESAVVARLTADLAGDGVITRFWGPTAVPRLLELDLGTMGFYYMLHDHPREIEALIDTIHEKELEAFRILANGPVDVIVLAENTSTFYISPPVYRKYSGPAIKEFADITHAAGKVAIVHMCGHVKGLLRDFRDLGFDGIHALTPPPTGDTPWELALDMLGEDTVIIGALDPTIWAAGPVDQIGAALDGLYTPRLRNANFILCPFADGIPVEVERFQAIAAWMDRNGAKQRAPRPAMHRAAIR
jgi:hypothetical protein